MNPEKNINPNEEIEREEQAINEPKGFAKLKVNAIGENTSSLEINPTEDEQLTMEKRMEEANDREEDLSAGWNPGE